MLSIFIAILIRGNKIQSRPLCGCSFSLVVVASYSSAFRLFPLPAAVEQLTLFLLLFSLYFEASYAPILSHTQTHRRTDAPTQARHAQVIKVV